MATTESHIITVRTYLIVYAALIVLLFATVGGAMLPLGALHLPVAMTIAVIKAVMIVLIFMHVYYSSALTKIVSIAALFWAALLLAITLADYFSRGWLDIPGK